MGKKFTSTTYSRDGVAQTIDIYDTSFSGSVTNFDIVADSLQMSWEADKQRPTASILTGTCTFQMVIDNSTLLAFINGLAAAAENKFRIVVSLAGSPYFVGVILSDQVEQVDRAYPFEFTIAAADGIARLKDVEYYDESTDPPQPYTSRETIIEHLVKIIDKIGVSDLLGTDALTTSVQWFEANHSGTTIDPLDNTRFNHKTLIKYDSKTGEPEYTDTYRVLQTIAENWKARFCMAAGKYWFVQIDQYEDDSFSLFNYDASGTATTSSTGVSLATTLTNKLFGGAFQFFPGLRRAEMEYIHRLSSNLISEADIQVGTTVEDVDNSGNVQIFFQTIAQSVVTVLGEPAYIKYGIQFNLNGQYYVRTGTVTTNGYVEYSEPEWSASVGYFEVFSQVIPPVAGTYSTEITILVPDIPASADLDIISQFTEYVALDGNIGGFTPPASTTFFDSYLEIADLSDRSNSKVYTADNANAGYSDKAKISSLIGDGPTGNAFGHLEVYDGVNWVVSSQWGEGTTAGTKEFHQLLVNQIVAGQTTPRKRFTGVWRGIVGPHEALTYNSQNNLPTELTINCGKDETQGRWFEVILSEADVAEASQKDFFIPKDKDAPISVGSGDTVSDPNGISDRNDRLERGDSDKSISIKIPPFVTDAGIDLGDTVTSIPVTEATENDIFIAGDKINVIDRLTGQTQTFTVTTDVEAGDTSIAVQSATATIDLSTGSYITLDAGELHGKLNRRWYRQTFADHTTATLTITENGGDLPEAASVHVYANGQRIFGYTINGSDIELGYTPNGLTFVVEFFA
jgi:hypothetical protein